MRQRLTWLVLFGAVIMVTAIFYAGNVWGTAANGFVATTLAKGTLAAFEVFNHSILPNSTGDKDDETVWLSMQKTKGSIRLWPGCECQPVLPSAAQTFCCTYRSDDIPCMYT